MERRGSIERSLSSPEASRHPVPEVSGPRGEEGLIERDSVAQAYDSIADMYEETIIYSSPFYREHYRAIARFLKRHVVGRVARGGRVADLGCGTGFWSRYLSLLGFDVVGIDISARSIEIARRRGLESLVGDIEYIGLRERSFDLVVALASVINHIDHYQRFFSEVSRLLRDGGYLMFDFDSAWSIDNLYEALIYGNSLREYIERLLKLDILREGYKMLWGLGKIKIRLYTPVEIIRELKKRRFEILRIEPIHVLSSVIPVRVQESTRDKTLERILEALHRLDDTIVNRLAPIPYPAPVSYIVLARKQ